MGDGLLTRLATAEAGVIEDGGCWGPDGMAPYPTLEARHFGALVPGLQGARNAAMRAAAAALNGEDARGG